MKRLSVVTLAIVALAAAAQGTPIEIQGDGIPKPLTSTPGSAARGKSLILAREPANCLTCHTVAKDRAMKGGDRGPALDGVGAALTPAQLRLSVVDFARINPKAVMPSFHRDAGKAGGDGKPVLTAQEVEDIVAYLSTLR